jgi:hypothetical protein
MCCPRTESELPSRSPTAGTFLQLFLDFDKLATERSLKLKIDHLEAIGGKMGNTKFFLYLAGLLPTVYCFSTTRFVSNGVKHLRQRGCAVQHDQQLINRNPIAAEKNARSSKLDLRMQQQSADFLVWASSQGILFDSLTLKSFNGVRGIGVDKSQTGDSTILTVPESKVLRVLAQSTTIPESFAQENYVSEKVPFLCKIRHFFSVL